jgi:pimeloyl-ACP methyl ester carboxylesterase
MPMLEMFMPYATVTLVRFQKWDEILKEPEPEQGLKLTGAFLRFARGMAYASRKQVMEAEGELKLLREITGAIPIDAPLGNSTARGVLAIAEHLLAGRIAQARGDQKTAIELLGKAARAEDAVNYNEPPDWDLPVREWLGGALIAAGDPVEAEKVFRAELKLHPRNGRALFGLMESLKRQKKMASARTVERDFAKAWSMADTKLSAIDLFGAGQAAARSTGNGAPGLRFADVRLKTGVRLHYAEQGNPAGQPIILLHGYTDSWFSFSRVLPSLDARYHVYALDLRGHGDSERPASGYKLSDFATDVLAFMDEKGMKRATIVGHSMGSFIAQQLAILAPERVERLVLIGSATTLRNNTVLDLQKAVNTLDDPVPAKFVREFQAGTIYLPLPEEFMDTVVRESLKVPARVWRATMEGFFATDYRSQLGRIKAPTLILWGERETIFPRPEQDSLVNSLANADLKVYPETGHALHWERPEQFVKDLEDFLKPAATR